VKIGTSPQIELMKNSASADANKEKKLRKACADFESIMLKQILSTARKSVPDGGIFTKGYAEKMYQSMNDDELARQLSANKGMGFGEMLYRQLSSHLHLTHKK